MRSEIFLALIGIGVLAVIWVVFRTRRARVRNERYGWELGDSFINFWPNPGIAMGPLHWCKARGVHERWRPRKMGLKPGVYSEGEPGYVPRGSVENELKIVPKTDLR